MLSEPRIGTADRQVADNHHKDECLRSPSAEAILRISSHQQAKRMDSVNGFLSRRDHHVTHVRFTRFLNQQRDETERGPVECADLPPAQEESPLRSSFRQADLTTKTPEHLVYTRIFGGLDGARDQIRTGDPHVGKEMLALISLRNFA